MTAGSCRVAIRRSRPPQWAHAKTSMANARCIRAAQVQVRGLLFTPVPSGPAASGGAEAVGSGATRPYATTRSRQRARGANRPWQMSRFVSGRGVIAARRSKELQRLEDQLSRPVVPRPLELQRDAPVAPPPQALLRKGRTQDVSAQTLHPRPIVRRHPHVRVQVEPVQVRLPRPARGHNRRVARITEPPHPRPRAGAQRHPPLDRSPDDPRQHGGLVREGIRRPRRVVAGLQAGDV